MNIQKLFGNNKPLATSGLSIPGLFHEAFTVSQGCERREETARARAIDLNRGFAP